MTAFCFKTVIILTAFAFVTLYAQNDSASISKEDVGDAAVLIGLEFTDAERDSMLDELHGQLNNYRNIRKIPLDNSIPPSVLFNPIPVGFQFNNNQLPVEYSDYTYTKLPEDINELAFYSVGELAHLIKTRQITSTRLTRFFLERLKKYGPSLQAVITITEERALNEAKKADEEIAAGIYKGMLHGIPYGVKDLLSTKDYKTTWGAEPYKDQVIDDDAAVIKMLSEAGAVLTSKLTLGALAWGDVWFGGITKNPWDTTKGSSGSSAGPASAVAAGLVPFAIGSETWGSIVSPSTVCGVTGLRPTYGRVSRTGAMALSWSMDKLGPICRTAEDLAIVFNSIIGRDNNDQTLYTAPFNYSPDINLAGLRIGYLKNDFEQDYPFRRNDSTALEVMRGLGAELIPIELPDLAAYDISIMLSVESAAAFDELTRSGRDDLLKRQIKQAWPNVFRAARLIPAVEYINASRLRYKMIQDMKTLFDSLDFYIAPSWNGSNLLVTNLTGHPCVVVPTGFTESGTLSSITFIANLFNEELLIAAAKKYQDASGHHLKHPADYK